MVQYFCQTTVQAQVYKQGVALVYFFTIRSSRNQPKSTKILHIDFIDNFKDQVLNLVFDSEVKTQILLILFYLLLTY